MARFSHILNFRDLGGLATEDGSIVRMRKLFRAAAPTDTTPAEQMQLVQECDIRTIIDLRTTFERNGAPDPDIEGVKLVAAPLVPMKTLGITFEDGNLSEMIRGKWNPDTFDIRSVYRDMADEAVADEWRLIFRTLLESDGHAVMWHCTNGKDRTGVVAAVVLLALGVPMDAVMTDYLATNPQLAARRHAILAEAATKGEQPGLSDKLGPLLEARPEYLYATIDAIEHRFDGFAGFLEDVCQLSIAEDDELRRLFLQ